MPFKRELRNQWSKAEGKVLERRTAEFKAGGQGIQKNTYQLLVRGDNRAATHVPNPFASD